MNKKVDQQFALQKGSPIWWNWLFISVFTRVTELYILLRFSSISTPLLLSVFVGLMVATLQWTIINHLVTGRSKQWIIVTWLGYIASTAISWLTFAPLERSMKLAPGFTEYDRIVVLFYFFWLVQALVLGTLQSILLSKRSKTSWRWIFILTSSIFFEFAIVYSTHVLAATLSEDFLIGLAIIGLVTMFTSSLTGTRLFKLLKTVPKSPALDVE